MFTQYSCLAGSRARISRINLLSSCRCSRTLNNKAAQITPQHLFSNNVPSGRNPPKYGWCLLLIVWISSRLPPCQSNWQNVPAQNKWLSHIDMMIITDILLWPIFGLQKTLLGVWLSNTIVLVKIPSMCQDDWGQIAIGWICLFNAVVYVGTDMRQPRFERD